ncbi:MAG: HVO_2922 family protein [Dehalococcoidia bacterium]|nr:HVO_2922 family protein [Dehalococcoidia bacterium]
MAAKFEIYKDKAGEFRWRLTHTNGQIIADSGQGYKAKEDAVKGISSLKENVPNAVVEDKNAQ